MQGARRVGPVLPFWPSRSPTSVCLGADWARSESGIGERKIQRLTRWLGVRGLGFRACWSRQRQKAVMVSGIRDDMSAGGIPPWAKHHQCRAGGIGRWVCVYSDPMSHPLPWPRGRQRSLKCYFQSGNTSPSRPGPFPDPERATGVAALIGPTAVLWWRPSAQSIAHQQAATNNGDFLGVGVVPKGRERELHSDMRRRVLCACLNGFTVGCL
jgi:hypothetical protein